jgi:hypothetical protein
MKKNIKDIIQLMKEKKYDEIYQKYGRETYLRVVSNKHQIRDIDKLMDEGRFFELYEKYGEKIYRDYLREMKKVDVENELGIKFKFNNYLFFENMTQNLKIIRNQAAKVMLGLTIVSGGFSTMISSQYDQVIENNSKVYQSEIKDYDEEIKTYAEHINSMNLSDLEIIMKVMNDMWNSIDGYKTPDMYDAIGYPRLALYMDGYGVCRNMADDFTARMNAINPNYEACNLNVYLKEAKINNIRRTTLVNYNTIADNSEQEENIDYKSEIISNLTGNHMVSCVKLKEDDVLLIVDPTNPSIGVLKNGEITMLSNQMMKGIKIKPVGNLMLGSDNRKEYLKKLTESLFTAGDINTLKEKYGITSQNETLEEIIEKYSANHYHTRKR